MISAALGGLHDFVSQKAFATLANEEFVETETATGKEKVATGKITHPLASSEGVMGRLQDGSLINVRYGCSRGIREGIDEYPICVGIFLSIYGKDAQGNFYMHAIKTEGAKKERLEVKAKSTTFYPNALLAENPILGDDFELAPGENPSSVLAGRITPLIDVDRIKAFFKHNEEAMPKPLRDQLYPRNYLLMVAGLILLIGAAFFVTKNCFPHLLGDKSFK